LSPAIGRDEKTWLERLEASARAQGFRADRIAIPDGMAADAAVHFPDDGELDNRLLGARLIELLRSRDVTIREHCAVAAIEALSDGSVRLTANGEHRSFDAVILATGNDDRLGEVDPALAARVPVKGEMLAVAAKGVCLPYCVRGQSVYLSQKPDGRIVIGATSQVGARDVVVDNAAIDELRRRAERFLPALAGLAEMERWAGIRPGTRDGQPIIGECRMPGVFLALGLYRNGVLFSPAAAEIIADAVLSGQQTPLAFSPRRFDER
jgi:glycine oxidase